MHAAACDMQCVWHLHAVWEQVRLASVRRSLFAGESERSAFLARLVTGTRDVLRSNQGLAEHANYHEFCRLLGRLKTNYQLSELARTHPGNLAQRCLYCTNDHAQAEPGAYLRGKSRHCMIHQPLSVRQVCQQAVMSKHAA